MRLRLACIAGTLALIACLPPADLRGDDSPAKPATTQASDDALLKELETLQSRLTDVRDLTTEFTQEKHTPLLRKPLTSSGRIRIVGNLMRWDTTKPAPSSMLITDDAIQLYYPRQKLLEIYPVDAQLARLAASPIPRMSTMREHFDFARLAVKEMDSSASDDSALALQLTPRDGTLQQHIERVRLLLDRRSAYLRQMEMIDADGDRTVIRFDEVRLNTGIDAADLQLKLPEGTRISRPLSPEAPANAAP